jgi:hypothetical protein
MDRLTKAAEEAVVAAGVVLARVSQRRRVLAEDGESAHPHSVIRARGVLDAAGSLSLESTLRALATSAGEVATPEIVGEVELLLRLGEVVSIPHVKLNGGGVDPSTDQSLKPSPERPHTWEEFDTGIGAGALEVLVTFGTSVATSILARLGARRCRMAFWKPGSRTLSPPAGLELVLQP